jgi:Tfp pilus assembly protein PilF
MPDASKPIIPAPTLAIIVLLVMIALYGIDKFLASQEQAELDMEARSHYAEGQKLLQEGHARAAVLNFSRARALQRSNREYRLSLAAAQLADHQAAAARETLGDLLAEDSNNGRANLVMARILVSESRFQDADAYYHRAIYGEWPANLTAEQQKVRLELANMLADHSSSQELLSELLLLASSPRLDYAIEKQIAQLFLQAGSASHAADLYHHCLSEQPDDIDAHLGLGQAETLAGNYRSAENAVMSALHRKPYDAHIQAQLRLVVKLASLDPTSRRLSTAEKYRRSERILTLVQDQLQACLLDGKRPPPPSLQGPPTNEKAEACLDEAETLWKQHHHSCAQPAAADDPLPILMKKLSQ